MHQRCAAAASESLPPSMSSVPQAFIFCFLLIYGFVSASLDHLHRHKREARRDTPRCARVSCPRRRISTFSPHPHPHPHLPSLALHVDYLAHHVRVRVYECMPGKGGGEGSYAYVIHHPRRPCLRIPVCAFLCLCWRQVGGWTLCMCVCMRAAVLAPTPSPSPHPSCVGFLSGEGVKGRHFFPSHRCHRTRARIRGGPKRAPTKAKMHMKAFSVEVFSSSLFPSLGRIVGEYSHPRPPRCARACVRVVSEERYSCTLYTRRR